MPLGSGTSGGVLATGEDARDHATDESARSDEYGMRLHRKQRAQSQNVPARRAGRTTQFLLFGVKRNAGRIGLRFIVITMKSITGSGEPVA